jgi:signal transduction histidine kinase
MGIGAFESRDFIRSLGGDIEVQSTRGTGSVFRVRIPCVEEPVIENANRLQKVHTL